MAALGFRPVDLPGTPVRALALAASRLPRFIAQPALTRALGGGRGDKMPSFHIDLHGGRGQTEVRFLNGAVVKYGTEHGVPTPVNTILTNTLEALSSGGQSIETYRHNPEALLALLG
jgi:2-dehydropantoate 2-reductase